MVVEHDIRTESLGSWRSKNDAEVAEAVLDIEFEIFEDLVVRIITRHWPRSVVGFYIRVASVTSNDN